MPYFYRWEERTAEENQEEKFRVKFANCLGRIAEEREISKLLYKIARGGLCQKGVVSFFRNPAFF